MRFVRFSLWSPSHACSTISAAVVVHLHDHAANATAFRRVCRRA
ncbi:hypothetical protein STXM2123_101 [Streptomyces sp. F-3]|nr:hypothetical protein STXM2123_101 [Streptomyces sp. F-3]